MMIFNAIVNINSSSLSARREHVGLFECIYLKFVPLMLESQAFLPGWGRAGWTLSCPQASEKLSGTSGQPWKQVVTLCALLPTYPNKLRNTLLSVCFNILIFFTTAQNTQQELHSKVPVSVVKETLTTCIFIHWR